MCCITVGPKGSKSFDGYLQLFHWTELIQSSPLAVERSVYEVVGGAYRKNNITTMELRFNPMKRNRGGERDLEVCLGQLESTVLGLTRNSAVARGVMTQALARAGYSACDRRDSGRRPGLRVLEGGCSTRGSASPVP